MLVKHGIYPTFVIGISHVTYFKKDDVLMMSASSCSIFELFNIVHQNQLDIKITKLSVSSPFIFALTNCHQIK